MVEAINLDALRVTVSNDVATVHFVDNTAVLPTEILDRSTPLTSFTSLEELCFVNANILPNTLDALAGILPCFTALTHLELLNFIS